MTDKRYTMKREIVRAKVALLIQKISFKTKMLPEVKRDSVQC